MNERRGMQAVAERDEYGERYEAAAHQAREDGERNDDSGNYNLSRPTETWRLLAEQLEPRIDDMARAVEGLHAAPYYVLQAESVQLCNPVNDLRVKVEAVRWMLRIAKHLNGATRDMVMATVSRSVEDLESVVEAQTRAMAQRVAA